MTQVALGWPQHLARSEQYVLGALQSQPPLTWVSVQLRSGVSESQSLSALSALGSGTPRAPGHVNSERHLDSYHIHVLQVGA